MPDQERPLTDADVVAPMPPEGEAGGEETPPSRVKVKIAGNEFEVDAPLAAALDDRETGFSQKLSEQGAELGQLRTTVGNLMATVSGGGASRSATEGETDEAQFWEKYQSVAYENPTEAAKLLEERQTKRYLADQARRQYRENWDRRLDRFYKDNPDLDGEDFLVDAVWREMAPKTKGLDMDKVLDEVANESRLRILKYAQRKEPMRPTSQGGRMAVVEGGGPVRTGGKGPDEDEADDSPKSMSEAIRRKQARHRGALQPSGVPGRKRRTVVS